jgi:hypothetical protein
MTDAVTTLRFTLEAIELRQRVAEAIAQDAAMVLGPDRLRLLLGEPVEGSGPGRPVNRPKPPASRGVSG